MTFVEGAASRAVRVQVVHTDVTLDDLWRLDLAKLDGWQCLATNTAGTPAACS